MCGLDLRAVNLKPIGDIHEGLVAGAGGGRAEDQLGIEFPVLGHVPLLGDLGVDERVVVLQVAAQALGLERRPHGELVHGVGLHGPDGELVGVEGELLLHGGDGAAVVEEHDLVRADR
jgi:hypothetical protein